MTTHPTPNRPAPYQVSDTLNCALQFDTRAFRNTLGVFPTGVAVVTALSRAGVPMGITINSFASVSLMPPLVLWSQAHTSPTHGDFQCAEHMVINILSDAQRGISTHFARHHDDKFAGIAWDAAPCGTPVLQGCAATLYCRASTHYEGGDHTIHLCEVETFENHALAPLVFCRGQYMDFASASQS